MCFVPLGRDYINFITWNILIFKKMKRFKLVAKYPGSPAIGTVIKQDPHGHRITPNGDGTSTVSDSYDLQEYPSVWKEIELPIFKTPKGEDIWEGDTVYSSSNPTRSSVVNADWKHWAYNGKYFFTEEEATEHLIMHCTEYLSLSELLDILPSTISYVDGIKDYVRTKLEEKKIINKK